MVVLTTGLEEHLMVTQDKGCVLAVISDPLSCYLVYDSDWPLLSTRTRCRPRFCSGLSSQRLLVPVRSKDSQPSSAGHNSRWSTSKRSTSLRRGEHVIKLRHFMAENNESQNIGSIPMWLWIETCKCSLDRTSKICPLLHICFHKLKT